MYIKLVEGTPLEYDLRNLKKENPNTSFPKILTNELLASFDIYPCKVAEDPLFDYLTEQVVKTGFSLVGDEWIEIKEVQKLPAQIAEENIRFKRDSLLKDSDWTHVTDSALTDSQKAAWSTYRQALRDITAQTGFPLEITWPTKPA